MSRNASVSVSITADIQDYAAKIGKLPDLTGDAAAKAGAELEAKIGKRLKAVADEARQAAKAVGNAGGSVAEKGLEAGKAISGIEGVGRIFGGTIGEVTGALGDLEAVFGSLPVAAGAAGLAIGGAAAAALYFYNKSAEARKEAEEFAKNLDSIAENAGPLTSRVLAENADLVDRLAKSQQEAADATQALAAREALDLAPSLIDSNNALIEQELLAARAAGSLQEFSPAEILAITAAAEDAVAEYNAFSDVTIKAREGVLIYDQAWAAAARQIRDAREAQADLNEEIGKNSVLIDGWIEGADSVLQTEAERQAAADAAEQRERARDEARKRREEARRKAEAARQKAEAEAARAESERLRKLEADYSAFTASFLENLQSAIDARKEEVDTLRELGAIREESLQSELDALGMLGVEYDARILNVRELAAAHVDNAEIQKAALDAELTLRAEYNREADRLRQEDARKAADARDAAFRASIAAATAERDQIIQAAQAAAEARRQSFEQTTGLMLDITSFAQTITDQVISTFDTQTKVGREAALQAFKVQKAFALTDIAIKTAQAIVGFLAGPVPNPIGAIGASITGAAQAAVVASQTPSFHSGRFGAAMASDESPAILRRGEVVVPSPLVRSAGGPEAVRDRLEAPSANAPITLVADFGDRRVTVPLARAARRGMRDNHVGWSKSNGF